MHYFWREICQFKERREYRFLKCNNHDLTLNDWTDNSNLQSDKLWDRVKKALGRKIIISQRKSVTTKVAIFSIANSTLFWRTEQMTSNSLEWKTCHLKSSLLENAISERLIITSRWNWETLSLQQSHLKLSGFQFLITVRTWTSNFISLFIFLHSVK